MTNLILTSSPWLPLGAPNVPTPQPTNEMVVGTCQADIIEEKLNLFVLLSIFYTIIPRIHWWAGRFRTPNGPLINHPSWWEMGPSRHRQDWPTDSKNARTAKTYSFRNHVHCWHLKEIRVLVDELNSTERRIEK